MVLGQCKVFRTSSFLFRACSQNYSKFSANMNIKKSVFISQSKDIFENLALEEWLYRNLNLKNHHVLMLWRNDPCVVIGRHQNPWLDVDGDHENDKRIRVARRRSGGGVVHQDSGNLNLTFFTSRGHHNKIYNMEIINRALLRQYNVKVDLDVNKLSIRGSKIGEAATRLGGTNAYYHCCLKVQNNKDVLHKEKASKDNKITSIKDSKINTWSLNEENPSITVDDLLSAIGWEYLRTHANSLKDGGKEFANNQKGFHMVNPTETWFSGIANIKDKFKSWEWCYGKTPTFTISRSLSIPDQKLNGCSTSDKHVKMKMIIQHGTINDISLFIPPGLTSTGYTGEVNVVTNLKEQRFNKEALISLMVSLGQKCESKEDKEKTVIEPLRGIVTSV